jgi:hypothetical protein
MKARTQSCPVRSLALEAEKLIARWNEIDQRKPDDQDFQHDLITDRLDTIKDIASYTTARSAVGASFQLMLACGEVDLINANVNPPDSWKRRTDRLIQRALEYVGSCDQLPEARSYYTLLGS